MWSGIVLAPVTGCVPPQASSLAQACPHPPQEHGVRRVMGAPYIHSQFMGSYSGEPGLPENHWLSTASAMGLVTEGSWRILVLHACVWQPS